MGRKFRGWLHREYLRSRFLVKHFLRGFIFAVNDIAFSLTDFLFLNDLEAIANILKAEYSNHYSARKSTTSFLSNFPSVGTSCCFLAL